MAYLLIGDKQHRLETECVLGRHRTCAVRIADSKASRQHARLFLLENEWWIEDLKSANGTLLNGGKLLARQKMADGDTIMIGKFEATLKSKRVATAISETIPDDMVGREIAGYKIDGQIGRGVTGTIFTATQIALERGVAFKVLDPSLGSQDAKFVERFIKTINKAASLTHDGLVKIHECGQNDGLLWYTMELVQGDTLDGLLSREGTLEPGLALMMIEKAADALLAAHTVGLAHGDVKPATIMLTETGHVKVLDIGVVGLSAQQTRKLQDEAATKQVYYLAPEQARGGEANVSGDIYSLGCVLFHVLSGKVPYSGKTFATVVEAHATQPIPVLAKRLNLSPEVDQVLGQMLAKNPEWRYESMVEVKTALRRLREIITPDAASEEAEKKARAKLATRAKVRNDRRRSDKQRQLLFVAVVAGVFVLAALIGYPYLVKSPAVVPDAGPAGPATTPSLGTEASATTPTAAAGSTGTANSGTPEKDPLRIAWQAASKTIDEDVTQNNWGAAELTLGNFLSAPEASAPQNAAIAELAHLRSQQLLGDGDTWYGHQVEKLPADSDPAGLAERLRALASLRDVTLSGNRADAEARYQEALNQLTQKLSVAKRRAREVIETGQLDELSQLSPPLEIAFADTPVVGLQQTFSALVQEALGIRTLWSRNWASTKVVLENTHGPGSLAAAAALILGGDVDGLSAARRLLADPSLSEPSLLRRKEALLGHAAAILTFKDPGDLQFIDTIQGEPQLFGGALRGDDACGISCTVPVGGPNWSAAVSLELSAIAGQSGEAVISCVNGIDAGGLVRIAPDAIHCMVKTGDPGHAGDVPEQRFDRAEDGGKVRLRFSCRDDVLQILINDKLLGSWTHPQIPAGSSFRCEFSGYKWAIREMQILGE